MEFINKIKNIIEDTFTDDTEDSTVLNPSNGNDNNIEDKRDKSMSDKVIEKALLGVKKYYQFKIKVINNVNYIENEWSFWDKNIQEINNQRIYEIISSLEDEYKSIQSDIFNYESNIDNLKKEYDLSNDEINKLQKQLNNTTNQNNRNNIQDKINLFRKNNNLIVLNLKENKNILNEYRAKQNDLEDDIINMAFRLIYGLSILPNTYEECIKIANKYEIGGNFIEIGLAAIGNYQCNNIEDALYYANEYFVQESYNPQVKHPIIDGLFLVILIENEAYESAKVIIEDLVEYYPESVKLHELIQKVHLGLHEYSEAALERKIIKLLT